ncbi:hypothetical protein H4R18_005734, partial [Coemansia javaensis]
MAGFDVDALALQEVRLPAERTEHVRRALQASGLLSRFSHAPPAVAGRQKGVAIVLADSLKRHLVGSDEVTGAAEPADPAAADAQQQHQPTGTGLRLRFAFRGSTQLHLIAAYVPPVGASNAEIRALTQGAVLAWLREAQSQGHHSILLGDLNERLLEEGTTRSALGRALASGSHWAEAHASLHGATGGGTSPRGTTRARIDFVYASCGLGPGYTQAAVVQAQTGLGEDHRMVVAELATTLGTRGPAQRPPSSRPRLNLSGATTSRRTAFRDRAEELAGPDEQLDDNLWHLAKDVFGTMAARKAAARYKCRLTRAGKLRLRLWQRGGGEHIRQAQWIALVREAHALLPAGLPTEFRANCEALAARDAGDWRQGVRRNTRFIARRLTQLRKAEGTGQRFRRINELVDKRADMMETDLSRMVRGLRRGRLAPALDWVVVGHGTDDARVVADPAEVERLASEHFAAHFAHPAGDRLELTGEWAGEYAAQEPVAAHHFEPISPEEVDWWMAHTPRRKAPGRSGLSFEVLRETGKALRLRL